MSICSTVRSKTPNAAEVKPIQGGTVVSPKPVSPVAPVSPQACAIARPRHGKIPLAVLYSGRSRSKLYQWAAQYKGLFLKDGASTLVDFDKLDEIMDSLPPAKITMPHLAKARPR
jgi:hypothetical protein